MKIVVTGAAGLTGAAVVAQLAVRGHEVRALVRRHAAIPGATTVAVGDCRDAEVLAPLLRGADALVHVAGILHGERMANIPVLRHVPAILAVSSAGVYSRHRASADAYLAGERALRTARADAVVIRPTMIYGAARDRNLHHVLSFADHFRFLPLFGDGRAAVQPIHYADLAAAIVGLTGRRGPAVIDAGGPEALSVRTAIDLVFAALGRTSRIVQLPLGPAVILARVIDTARGSRFAERIERLTEHRSVDNGTLIRETGIALRPLAAGLREQVAEMRAIGLLRG